jgi:SAM-dependent methyltransferase
VGAGPGYATLDLADLVGDAGEVAAVERSAKFASVMRDAVARRGLGNVKVHELDLMNDPIPGGGFDVAWCRWVACFVASPQKLVESIRRSLRIGGRVVFHEYANYKTWQITPRKPAIESFVETVMASWRATGGEPDVGLALPGLLHAAGFRLIHAEPIVFAVRPGSERWRWPASFIRTNVPRMRELGHVDAAWCERVTREWREAEADPTTILFTPMVLELIAARIA